MAFGWTVFSTVLTVPLISYPSCAVWLAIFHLSQYPTCFGELLVRCISYVSQKPR